MVLNRYQTKQSQRRLFNQKIKNIKVVEGEMDGLD